MASLPLGGTRQLTFMQMVSLRAGTDSESPCWLQLYPEGNQSGCIWHNEEQFSDMCRSDSPGNRRALLPHTPHTVRASPWETNGLPASWVLSVLFLLRKGKKGAQGLGGREGQEGRWRLMDFACRVCLCTLNTLTVDHQWVFSGGVMTTFICSPWGTQGRRHCTGTDSCAGRLT